MLKQFFQSIFNVPESIPPQYSRHFSLSNSAAIGGGIGHFVLLISFLLFEIDVMAWVNVGSVFLFSVVFWINRKGYHQTALFISIIEIMIHAILAVVLMGWDTGFHVYLLIIPIASFLSNRSFDRISLIITVLNVLIYSGLYWYHEYFFVPHIEITNIIRFFYYQNNLFVTLFIISSGAFYYKYTANKTEEKLQQNNKSIMDSIRYAKRIQSAILPDEEILSQHVQDFFIFYQPKDVVSGDFYWFKFFEDENQNQKLVISAIDCTGHGVPGAFMTMIANALLEKIVSEQMILDPAQILTLLREEIIYLLKQKQGRNYDGMDMSLCTLDLNKKELTFAGAMNSIYLIQEVKLIELKATKIGIGGVLKPKGIAYKNQMFSFEKSTMLFLFTDGLQDQFGGDENRKFSRQRLRKLLLQNHHLPCSEQKNTIEQVFEKWRKDEKQIDDILLMGLKI